MSDALKILDDLIARAKAKHEAANATRNACIEQLEDLQAARQRLAESESPSSPPPRLRPGPKPGTRRKAASATEQQELSPAATE